MKPHHQTPSLPRIVPDLLGEHCFYPLETFSLKLEKVRFLVTQGQSPRQRSASIQDRDTRALPWLGLVGNMQRLRSLGTKTRQRTL